MSVSAIEEQQVTGSPVAHFDVLIVGAGVSGIGCAYHLQAERSGQELRGPRGARGNGRDMGPVPLPGDPLGLRPSHPRLRVQAMGGREGDRRRAVHPALHTRDSQRERDRRPHPPGPPGARCVTGRAAEARWTVTAVRTNTGESVQFTCSMACSAAGGYYSYEGDTHPTSRAASASRVPWSIRRTGRRTWTTPGKRVVVIGSGATAVTLIPAMSADAEHVTMLQRSPTYVISVPEKDPIANAHGSAVLAAPSSRTR